MKHLAQSFRSMNISTQNLSQEASEYICELLIIYRARTTSESRLAAHIIGLESGTRLRWVFYTEAAVAGWLGPSKLYALWTLFEEIDWFKFTSS